MGKTIIKLNILPREKKQPGPFTNQVATKCFINPEWEVHSLPLHKTLQRNEKFNCFGYGSRGINHF